MRDDGLLAIAITLTLCGTLIVAASTSIAVAPLPPIPPAAAYRATPVLTEDVQPVRWLAAMPPPPRWKETWQRPNYCALTVREWQCRPIPPAPQ